ncbi:MAG: phosphodiesterase YaeI [Bryobacteraceae bacterium]
MTRRGFVYSVVGASAAAVSYPCYLEPRWLDVTENRVKLGGIALSQPVRVLHLSDLHASFEVPLSLVDRAITLGLEQKPDLVCLTGDYISRRSPIDSSAYVRALRRLSAAAPSFAVMENHDGGIWAEQRRGYSDHRFVDRILEESGIELLHNRSMRVQVRDASLSLVGVGDVWSGEIDTRAFAELHPKAPVVLLSHNPDSKDVLGRFQWDLMLSGHTHGGQVIIPFQGPSYAPVIDKRYVAGLKAWGSRQIHVTRGVGNLAGVRFRCRPEVSVLVVG